MDITGAGETFVRQSGLCALETGKGSVIMDIGISGDGIIIGKY